MAIKPMIYLKNEEAFRASVRRAGQVCKDLTIPFTLIAKDFYKSEKAIFMLRGPGQYADLADSTKKQKQKLFGRVYPILKATGALEKSVTDPTDPNAVNEIIDGRKLVLGTTVTKKGVPYPKMLQEGTVKMPSRPFFFIGPEGRSYSVGEIAGRAQRWISIMDSYVKQVLKSQGKK